MSAMGALYKRNSWLQQFFCPLAVALVTVINIQLCWEHYIQYRRLFLNCCLLVVICIGYKCGQSPLSSENQLWVRRPAMGAKTQQWVRKLSYGCEDSAMHAKTKCTRAFFELCWAVLAKNAPRPKTWMIYENRHDESPIHSSYKIYQNVLPKPLIPGLQ